MASKRCKLERLVLFAPIEQLEERYSVQWYKWFMKAFEDIGATVQVFGDTEPRVIKQGQFLDIYDTNIYKAKQVADLLKAIEQIKHDNFTVFCMDAWFTGLEALAYVRSCTHRKFKIKGMVHAGTWDKWDFLHQKNCQTWAKDYERSLFKIFDEVFCATQSHKDMIESYFEEKFDNITLVDFPVINPNINHDKENIVVFPHRLALEKQPDQFDILEAMFNFKYPEMDVRFIKSKNVCHTKDQYYNLLKRSKVAVSCALQETFGIAMLEAFHLGCFPVVPDRLSYRETFEPLFRYKDLDEAVNVIHLGLTKPSWRKFDYKYGEDIKWADLIIGGK